MTENTMSEWPKGNVDAHKPAVTEDGDRIFWCSCWDWRDWWRCTPDDPCYCCEAALADEAEVNQLRANVGREMVDDE